MEVMTDEEWDQVQRLRAVVEDPYFEDAKRISSALELITLLEQDRCDYDCDGCRA